MTRFSKPRVSRHQLLGSCAIVLSLAAAGYSPKAEAQTFPNQAVQGTITSSTGINEPFFSTNADTISLSQNQAVINWTPSNAVSTGTIDFLPATKSVTFTGPSDFVVLNRVIPADPTRAISINGTVNSQIGPSGQAGDGGSVWFYSPGGIVVGSTASFNVGNLVLSTAELTDSGNGLFGPGNSVAFGSAANPASATSAVTIMSGASFLLANPGSYLAVVSPNIVQGGTVDVNGSVAYIAAAQANVSINAGLFDISYATDGASLIHTGTTTGPTQTGGTITFAAVGKNTAISALLSGTIGYTPAASATVDNGQVVLLGGYTSLGFGATPTNASPVDFVIGGGTGATSFTSSVMGRTNGNISAVAGSVATPLAFTGHVDLSGDVSAKVGASDGGVLTIDGNLRLASRSTPFSNAGTASLYAQALGGAAATVTVAGTTTIDTSAVGAFSATGVGGTGTGGTSSIAVDGSTMTLTGSTSLRADGFGGESSITGGAGQGGTALVEVTNTASGLGLTASTMDLSATGVGGGYGSIPSASGGDGTGGIASVTVENANLTIDSLAVVAEGIGGYGAEGTTGGNGKGGTVNFKVAGTSVVQLEGLNLIALGGSYSDYSAQGPSVPIGSNGGRGDGGTVNLDFLGGATTIGTADETEAFYISAQGNGSSASSSSGYVGRLAGAGTGGTVNFNLTSGTVATSGAVITANGTGGGNAESGDYGTVGGAGTGGAVIFTALGGSFTGPMGIDANGTGGAGDAAGYGIGNAGNGGLGTGGTIDFFASGANFSGNALELNAMGRGGIGGAAENGYGSFGGAGGGGSGGIATLNMSAGSLRFASISLDATGNGGDGGNAGTGSATPDVISGLGGNAMGGQIFADITGGTTEMQDFGGSADAFGGSGGYSTVNFDTPGTAISVVGGTATGGSVRFGISSSIDIGSFLNLTTDARGGSGGDGGSGQAATGSDAFGGTSSLIFNGGGSGVTQNASYITVSSTASGGTAGYGNATGAAGGNATGGRASFTLAGGIMPGSEVEFPDLTVDASAIGGTGSGAYQGFVGGRGGNAVGGNVSVTADGAVLNLSSRTLNFDASGTGGEGGNGSDGFGGVGSVGSNGGAGGDGGTATGGNMLLQSTGANAELILGGTDFGNGVNAFGGTGGEGGQGADGARGIDGSPAEIASGIGGDGTDGENGFAGGRGGNGGNGTAGMLTVEANNLGKITAGDAVFSANGYGGNNGFSGSGGSGGDGGYGGQGGPGEDGQNGGAGGNAGNGGAGGNAGGLGNTGYGVGGNVVISANGGSFVAGNVSVNAIGYSGLSRTLTGLGGVGGSGGLGAPGGAAGAPLGGTIPVPGQTGTNGVAGADGAGSVADGPDPESFGGTVSFNTLGGAAMTFASLTATAGPETGSNVSGAINFTLSDAVTVAGAVVLDSAATVDIAATGSGALLAGGTVTIDAADSITIGHVSPVPGAGVPSFVTMRGNGVTLSALSVLAEGSSIVSTGNLSVQTSGGMTLGAATAAGALTLGTAGGNIAFGELVAGTGLSVVAPGTVTGTSANLGAGLLTLNGDMGITVPTVVSGGDIGLYAANGAINVATNVSAAGQTLAQAQSLFLRSKGAFSAQSLVATAGGVDVLAAGDLFVANTQAAGDVSLVSAGGNLSVGTIGSATALVPTSITLVGSGSATLGGAVITGGDLDIQSSGGATTINGLASGRTVSIASPDIVIGGNARVGTAGTTTSVSFTNNSNATTTIGGSTATTGYVLDNAELQRVSSNRLGIFVPLTQVSAFVGGRASASVSPNTAPDVILDTMSLSGGPAGSFAGGTFHIETPGKLRVVGTVALTNLASTDRFEIVANDAIEAVPTGSITMTGINGALTGTLALTSADIIAASPSALADIAGAANLTAASDRIGGNDGAVNDMGYFAAGGIVATVGNSIYIQNSGAATTAGNADYNGRRGFTVGSGGLTIVQANSAPIKIAVNGRQIVPASAATGAGGGTFTGLDMISRTAIVGPGQAAASYDPLSTINGCTVATGVCGAVPPPPPPPPPPVETVSVAPTLSIARDTIEHAVEQFQAEGQLLPVALVQFQDFKGFIDQPLIDEPVTGAGNDDLYSLDDSQSCAPGQKPPCK
jgi:filamentous hemagglutinin family protein